MSSNITVSVPRAETQTDARTGNTYASYVIEAVNPEGLSWCRSFRYSDLHKFHFHLLAQMEDKKEAERLDKIFPPKRVFNNSFSVVEERRKALSRYFIALVSSPYIKPRLYLLRTLGLDQPPVPPSQRSSTGTAKIPTAPVSRASLTSTPAGAVKITAAPGSSSRHSHSNLGVSSSFAGHPGGSPSGRDRFASASSSALYDSPLDLDTKSFGKTCSSSSGELPVTVDRVRAHVPGFSLSDEIPFPTSQYPLHVHFTVVNQLFPARSFFRAQKKISPAILQNSDSSILGPILPDLDSSFTIGLASLSSPSLENVHHAAHPYIVKLFLASETDLETRSRLNHEASMLSRLSHVTCLPRLAQKISNPALEFSGALVLEDTSDRCVPLSLIIPLSPSRASVEVVEFKERLSFFFEFALKLSSALGSLHEAGVVHNAINPQSIWCDLSPRSQSKTAFRIDRILLMNLEFSTLMSMHDHPQAHAALSFDTSELLSLLPYMAPEQSNRIKEKADYRADYYSLGVVLFQIITDGRLPLIPSGLNQIIKSTLGEANIDVHQYLFNVKEAWYAAYAQQLPSRADQIGSLPVPAVVAEIIAKLLCLPAQRYTSLEGIRHDLRHCRANLDEIVSNPSFSFPLGQNDLAGSFQIPNAIYARTSHSQSILNSFARIREGARCELVLVHGEAGIGKSHLISHVKDALQKISQQDGGQALILHGKFQRFSQVPYGAIRNFRGLASFFFSQDPSFSTGWADELRDLLGDQGKILVSAIPELAGILGSDVSPVDQDLSPDDASNRFNHCFSKMMSVIASGRTPVVLIFDDLQWADVASLSLLYHLMTKSKVEYCMILGAYRDGSELTPTFSTTLAHLESKRCPLLYLKLTPLRLPDLVELIRDLVGFEPLRPGFDDMRSSMLEQRIVELAELIVQRTDGVPFFVRHFLERLYHRKLFWYNFSDGLWYWDVEEIRTSCEATFNVATHLATEIAQLNSHERQLLELASCIGSQFTSSRISALWSCYLKHTSSPMDLDAGIILADLCHMRYLSHPKIIRKINAIFSSAPLPASPDDGMFRKLIHGELPKTSFDPSDPFSSSNEEWEYRFAHDFVFHTIYQAIPAPKAADYHLLIGKYLLDLTGDNTPVEHHLFELVTHLHLGAPAINPSQHDLLLQIVKLELFAAKSAKNSAAVGLSVTFLQHALDTMTRLQDTWMAQNPEETQNLKFELYLNAFQCHYLNHDTERANQLSNQLATFDLDRLQRVKVAVAKIQLHTTTQHHFEALQAGSECLRLFGIMLNLQPSMADILQLDVAIQNLMQEKNLTITGIGELPPMTDPQSLAISSIINHCLAPSFFCDHKLFIALVLTITHFSLSHGNTDVSLVGYTWYGVHICYYQKRFREGYMFGEMAYKLLKIYPKFSGLVTWGYGDWLRFWGEDHHIADGIEYSMTALHMCLDAGQINYAAYIVNRIPQLSFSIGDPLSVAESHAMRCLAYAQQVQRQGVALIVEANYRTVCALMDKPYNANSSAVVKEDVELRASKVAGVMSMLGGNNHHLALASEAPISDTSEVRLDRETPLWLRILHTRNTPLQSWFYIQQMSQAYLLCQFQQGLELIALSEPIISASRTNRFWNEHYFWASLILTHIAQEQFAHALGHALFPFSVPDQLPASSSSISLMLTQTLPEVLQKVKMHMVELKLWAEASPLNFRGRFMLVKAEYHMLKNNEIKAQNFYDLALTSFNDSGFLHLEGVACELFARFFLFNQKVFDLDRARNYYMRAQRCYADWGAEEIIKRTTKELGIVARISEAESTKRMHSNDPAVLSSNRITQLVRPPPDSSRKAAAAENQGEADQIKSGALLQYLQTYVSHPLTDAETTLLVGISQSFSSDPDPRHLIESSFKRLLRYSRATRGFLIHQYSNQNLYIEVAAESDPKQPAGEVQVQVLHAQLLQLAPSASAAGQKKTTRNRNARQPAKSAQPASSDSDQAAPPPLPLSIINFVRSVRQPAILDGNSEALQLSSFEKSDPYLAGKALSSILCIPVVIRGESSVMLYLENPTVSGLFTQLNLLIINNVASQIVLFIEHFRLNHRLLHFKKQATGKLPNSDRVIRSGWLNKLSESLFWNTWNQCWVVMTRNDIHFYKSSSIQGKPPLSSISFDQVKQVNILGSTDAPGLVRPRSGTVFVIRYVAVLDQASEGPSSDVRSDAAEHQVYLSALDRTSAGVWFSTLTKLVAEAQPVYTRPEWEPLFTGVSSSPASKNPAKPEADLTLRAEDIRLKRLLGSGASAEVYRGIWNGLTVAVKKLRDHSSEGEIRELLKELHLLAALRHPYVVQFLGVYMEEMVPQDGSVQKRTSYAPCIVTEFMEKGSLFHVLHLRKTDLPLHVKFQIAFQSAQGMTYLHSKSPPIIHRDLKSLNILIGHDYTAKICDFGLARAMPKQSAAFMTARLGTSLWMSPEVFTSSSYSPLTDVFSFGIVLWEIWTRLEPYGDLPSTIDIPYEVCHHNLRPTIPPSCPPAWVQLMKSCWHADPNSRPSFKSIVGYLKKFESSMTNQKKPM